MSIMQEKVIMSNTVIASNGVLLPIDNLTKAYGYDGSGNLITETVVYRSPIDVIPPAPVTYVKTYTYTGTNLTNESIWIAQ